MTDACSAPGMTYRRLGRTGLEVSSVSLGTWATFGESVGDDTATAILRTAREHGINLLDTAETYGHGASEEALGRALRRVGWERETYAVCGKVFWGVHGGAPLSRGLSRKHIREGCHATLRRLGLDHLDLFLCHRPDAATELEETVRAMSDLVQSGEILYWGTSEWSPGLVSAAIEVADRVGGYRPVTEQLQYNLFVRDRVEVDFAELRDDTGLGVMTWSPLAYGLLAGRYGTDAGGGRLNRPGYEWLLADAMGADPAARREFVARLAAVATEAGLSCASLAIGWVLRNNRVDTAICGASTPQQLSAAAAAGRGLLVEDEVWTRVEELLTSSRESEFA